jgi:hypothetical protein
MKGSEGERMVLFRASAQSYCLLLGQRWGVQTDLLNRGE